MLQPMAHLQRTGAPHTRTSLPDAQDCTTRHSDKFISGLLLSFAAVWGNKWTSQIETVPHDVLISTWAEGLAEMTPDEIRARYRDCAKRLAWPPSLAEFLGADEQMPKSQEDWHAFGRVIGQEARPGEGWDSYIARLRHAWTAQPLQHKRLGLTQSTGTQMVTHE